jgi:periplasmic protein TonB
MESKKNPKYDVHQKRGVLLNVGLVVSLIIVITAFKWTVPVRGVTGSHRFDNAFQEAVILDDPRITTFKKIEIPKAKQIKVSVPLAADFKEVKDVSGPESERRPIDQGQVEPIDVGGVEIPAEIAPPDTFRVVEKMPEPIGGWASFYKTLTKNFKYPKQAQRVRANGKVFVEFTVNDKGELSHFKIIKGIGYGCDEEAKRVIALTKWTAGKQRGRPVNVKMVQPIVFDIGN